MGDFKIITVLRDPTRYRLALTWPLVEKKRDLSAGDKGDPWAGLRFSFEDLARLARVCPRETLCGFEELKAFGIITPDGLHELAETFFEREGLLMLGAKPARKKKEAAGED